MKKHILLLLLSLLTFTGQAQTYYKYMKVKRTYNGTLQRGKALRNMQLYPNTNDGKLAFLNYVNAGCVSVTLNSGTVLAANCQPTVIYSQLLAARYSYTPSTRALDIELAPVNGASFQLKYTPATGSLPPMQSSGGQNLQADTYYSPGTLSGQGDYNQEWSSRKTTATNSGLPPGSSVTLTFKRISDQATQVYTLPLGDQPVTRQQIILAAGNTSPPTDPPTNPGNGNTGPTDPINTGSFLTYNDEGWGSDYLKFIENDVFKVGFGRQGGIVRYAALKSDNRNVVNDYLIQHPQTGQTVPDLGRQWMFGSDYFTPGNAYVINGKSTASGYQGYVFDTGGNVVQGGSLYPALDESLVIKSAVVQTQDRGPVFCAQIRARIWGVQGEFGHIILDEECWLSGNTLAYKARHTVENRPSNVSAAVYQTREQENPCLYVLAPFTTHLAKVNGQQVNRFPPNWQGGNPFSNTIFTDECWIGAYEGSGGTGVTYYSPMNSAVRSGQFQDVYGNEHSNASSYLNAALAMNYDNAGSYVDYGYIIVGTQSAALSKIATLPGIDQSFSFDFTGSGHRWNNYNCRGIRESGAMAYYIGELNQDGGTFGTIRSPARAWQASGITSISFDMAASNVQTLWLEWKKPGEENDDSRRFRKAVQINGDGQRHTYTVSTSDSNWSGIISTIGLTAIRADGMNGSNPVTPQNAKLLIYGVAKQ